MWESVNSIWLELCEICEIGLDVYGISGFFDWVKNCFYLFCGVIYGMVMCSDVFCFLCLGIFIECVDNIVWIFDVKYQIGGLVGDMVVDFYCWYVLL